MVKIYFYFIYKVNFFNFILNFLKQFFFLKNYLFIWRGKINKKNFIGKWFNNYSKYSNSSNLLNINKNKKLLIKIKNYFWLSFFSKQVKYSIKSSLLNNNYNISSGLQKLWKINYLN